jgi:hypothetical protein
MSLMTTFVLIAAGLLAVPALAEAVPGPQPQGGPSVLSAAAIGLALVGGGLTLTLLGRRRAR